MSREGSPIGSLRSGFDAANLRIAVIASHFNRDVTDRLVTGAMTCFSEHGVKPKGIEVIRVPGAWELPQAASTVLQLDRHDAIVTLGCVIRGETPHFEYVCSATNNGVAAVALEAPIPVVFGVLTTENRKQALERARERGDNKGYEAAMAALQMIDLYRSLASN